MSQTLPRLVVATRNAKKLVELHRILADHAAVELLGLGDLPPYEEVPESGATFADNALLKAREAARHTGLPAVADDSGLTVRALNDMPGVLSARWSGRDCSDERNLQLVLDQVADVPDERLAAAFVCAAALVTPDGEEQVVEGIVSGSLVRVPRGTNGFGYDPIFQPVGQTRTMAELGAEEKDALSHRGRALRALAPYIATAVTR